MLVVAVGLRGAVSSGLMTPAMTDADAVLSGCWEFGGLGSPLAWAGKRNPKGLRLFAPRGEGPVPADVMVLSAKSIFFRRLFSGGVFLAASLGRHVLKTTIYQ